MLYIFRVDTGSMITLEMNLALETVAHLKKAVASTWGIPKEKQVLLISGGESLELEERVCKYTAGSSDTNPIFLFCMASIESNTPPTNVGPGMDSPPERDLQPEVEASLSLPDTHNTVAVRATLAQEYVKVSREQARICESQIHDQHLQHQGWAAALANLEDSVVALEKRHTKFTSTFSTYLAKRDHFREVIETFDEDLHTLSKIPVLPALVAGLEEDSGHGSNGGAVASGTEGSRPSSSQGNKGGKTLTLLDWIQQAGNHSLEQVADSCYRSLEQLDGGLLESVGSKVATCVEGANNQQMKEIRGLGDRLSGLEQLLLDAKRKVTEQQDLAAAFLQNQARASGLRDTSILPDLCASHRQQLLVMMRNHQHILSIRKRCAKAKEELSYNLYTRLKWVMFIQRQMAESGQQLVLYHEELKRLSRRLEVMEQLHLAPSIYLATVVEVVRRRSFSEHYLKKAAVMAGTFGELHSDEVQVRRLFQEKLESHFLSTMFNGMDDIPPDFATVPPADFDQMLPRISLQDLEQLRADFPNIAETLSMPDRTTLSSLLTRSFTQALTPEEGTALQSLQNITSKIPGLSSVSHNMASVSMINRICGSEGGSSGGQKERKKSRLDAMAASRERREGEVESDSDSDKDTARQGAKNGRPKNGRKASRSLTTSFTKQEAQTGKEVEIQGREFVTENYFEEVAEGEGGCGLPSHLVRGNLSSSSVEPSSSSAANTNSSAAPSSDGSLLKHQWPSQTELQAQVEDKNKEIERLQGCLSISETRLQSLEGRVAGVLGVNKAGLDTLRDELAGMREKVDTDRQDMLTMLAEMTKRMVESLVSLEEVAPTTPRDMAKEVRAETELAEVSRRLETELNKLDDCHREIEIYRYQLGEATKFLDLAKSELAEAKEQQQQEFDTMKKKLEGELQDLKAKFKLENKELKQKLELEHELELDTYKQQMEFGESNRLEELIKEGNSLRKRLEEKEVECKELKTKAELIDATQEEKITEEKEKIVQILEAGFSERQKVAINQLETKLTDDHRKEIEDLKEAKTEEMLNRLEELRQKMVDSSQISTERLKSKLEKEHQTRMKEREEELRQEFCQEKQQIEDSKQAEIEEVREKIRKKSKMEMESLRSRFKMMQTTGTLERSPSVSESELSLESPRPDSMEHIANVEQRWGGERVRWEQEREKMTQLVAELQEEVEDCREQVKEARASERLRSSAEKQVIFNEAIRAAVDEKDKKIEALETMLGQQKAHKENQSVLSTLEDQLAEVMRKNAQLESELRDAQGKLGRSMVGSIAVVGGASDSMRQLQEENQQLKQQLSRSMTSLISTGKVSVTSADKGEIVLVVWAEEHNNYQVYHEGVVLHFLHTDSIEVLGLQERGGVRRKHTTAEVVDKEYCQAKKTENRFRVKQGTKFYRVRCKLIDKEGNSLARSLRHAHPL